MRSINSAPAHGKKTKILAARYIFCKNELVQRYTGLDVSPALWTNVINGAERFFQALVLFEFPHNSNG